MSARERRVKEFWARRRPVMRERVWRLQLLAERLAAGRAPGGMLCEGREIAGQLAGSLGVFGFMEGSRMAREIECLLEEEPIRTAELAACVCALSSGLEAFTPATEPGSGPTG